VGHLQAGAHRPPSQSPEENYLPIVRYNAERIHVKLPSEVELDDLVSAGLFGLMDAIDAYDPTRGVKFETYCAPRIRGSILDELRNMDWVPRLVRARAAKVDAAVKALEAESGQVPTIEELSRHMQVPVKEAERMARDALVTGKVSLSRKWFETDSNKDVREIDVLEDKQAPRSLERVMQRDFWDRILRGSNRAERMIVSLYYCENLTMKEIGAALDLSESRVSQMHSSILNQLKVRFTDDPDMRAELEQSVSLRLGRRGTATA
jgi:RNA polymerase sigma factor for flagellar operon FliA